MPDLLKKTTVLDPRKKAPPVSLSELYHENTKLHPGTIMVTAPPAEFTVADMKTMARAWKEYPSAVKVPLPPVKEISGNSKQFEEVVCSRRSIRTFADEDMSIEELSRLLFLSYGLTGAISIPGEVEKQFLRSSPSAGALYPAEIYLGLLRVSGIKPGIYHYHVPSHSLELLIAGDHTEELCRICCGQEYVRHAGVIVMMSGVFERTKRKYGERGYRYVLLDVGHLGQNIYLASTALELAVMTTCGFYDDEANRFLNLDGIDETMVYVAFVGKNSKAS